MTDKNIIVVPVGITGPLKTFLLALAEKVAELEAELEVLRNG